MRVFCWRSFSRALSKKTTYPLDLMSGILDGVVRIPPPVATTMPPFAASLLRAFASIFLKAVSPSVSKIVSMDLCCSLTMSLSVSTNGRLSAAESIFPHLDFPQPDIPIRYRFMHLRCMRFELLSMDEKTVVNSELKHSFCEAMLERINCSRSVFSIGNPFSLLCWAICSAISNRSTRSSTIS